MTETPDRKSQAAPAPDNTAAGEAEWEAGSEQTAGATDPGAAAESLLEEDEHDPPIADDTGVPPDAVLAETAPAGADAAGNEFAADSDTSQRGLHATEAPVGAGSSLDVASLLEAVEKLGSAVDEQARFRQRDQELIDRLHSENERLRQGELREVQRPLLTGLSRLHDTIEQLLASGAEGKLDLGFVREGILDTLEGAGLELIDAAEGEEFERGLHRAASRRATENEAEDRRIARVRRAGFSWADGTVFRPAEVDVYVLAPVRTDGGAQEATLPKGHQQKAPPGAQPSMADPEKD